MSARHGSWGDDDPWGSFGEADTAPGDSGRATGKGGGGGQPAGSDSGGARSVPDPFFIGGDPFSENSGPINATDPFEDPSGPWRRDAAGGSARGGDHGEPPVWLLAVAGVAALIGLLAAVWSGTAVPHLLAVWFICGFVVLGLLVTFTWLDVRRRARFHYASRPDLSLIRAVILLVSVGGVVVAAVRVSLLVGHYGWSALWS